MDKRLYLAKNITKRLRLVLTINPNPTLNRQLCPNHQQGHSACLSQLLPALVVLVDAFFPIAPQRLAAAHSTDGFAKHLVID